MPISLRAGDPMTGDPISGAGFVDKGVFYAAVLSVRGEDTVILSEAESGNGLDGLKQIASDIVKQESLKNPGLNTTKSICCIGMSRASAWYKVEGRILYLGIVDDHTFGSRRAIAFIDSFSSKFKVKYQGSDQTQNTQLFDPELKKEVAYWSDMNNTVSAADQELENKMNNLKQTAINTMSHTMERHGKIEMIGDQSESLVTSTTRFTQSAKAMRWKLCWANAKCWIMIAVGLLLVLMVILMIACDPNFKKCK
eukprot:TRINITY_DN12095_c0_g3_i1.p1 TRINITY_DN12095_c0_g3~~TRINITY_DN12095_c0_g3_i1.p1  ORF type:complete len:253 (+),score=69.93 TRINITY_DN12095_c0_g3_i1:161-919(+)